MTPRHEPVGMSHFLHIHGLLQLHQRPSLLETTPFPLPHSPNCALVDQVNSAAPPLQPSTQAPGAPASTRRHVYMSSLLLQRVGLLPAPCPFSPHFGRDTRDTKIVAPPSAVGQEVGGGVRKSRGLLVWISHAPCEKLPRGAPHNSTACSEDPPSSPQHAVCSGASLVINTTCPRVSLNSLLLTTHPATGDCKKGK